MTRNPRPTTRRGLALIEVLVALVMLAVVISGLVLTAARDRRESRLAGSFDNLRFFAAGTQSYAADNANRFWTFSWQAGPQNTEYPDLNFAVSDLQAAANQAVYIMRRLGTVPEIPAISNWVPHIQYSYLPLIEHQGLALPSRVAVSPEDRVRLSWQRDAAGFLALPARPSGSGGLVLRWIYSGTYELGPAFWSPDAASGPVQTVTQSSTHNTYFIPGNTLLGNRTLDQVRYPANKAQMWDSHQRDLGRRVPFFAVQDARVPVLCADGAVGLRSTRYTNLGFQPSSPQSIGSTTFSYQPDPFWEPPAVTPGQSTDLVQGQQRWTRWGLRGRDFNGPEATGP